MKIFRSDAETVLKDGEMGQYLEEWEFCCQQRVHLVGVSPGEFCDDGGLTLTLLLPSELVLRGGSMEGGLLLLAEPSGVISGKFNGSLIKTLTLLARESVSGVSCDGRINSWP